MTRDVASKFDFETFPDLIRDKKEKNLYLDKNVHAFWR